ncbi:MAG TPA: DUF975 family protein [Candidatus Cloacimonadota bacterium]|nr:DUF975 family protein [Candidatus Cloacimonadota bacterium]
MDRVAIRTQARALLAGKWNLLALIWLAYFFIESATASLPGSGLIIAGPFALGLALLSLRVVRNQDINVEMLFDGFSDFVRSLVAGLLMIVFVFLWSLLLIVPGIIAALSYSMTFYILADNPDVTASEAITMSKNMMFGHKAELFWLYLSFIGWAFLCLFTAGIGFLWLLPYIHTSTAIFYENLRGAEEVVIS